MNTEHPNCPKCGNRTWRESVDIGVGVIYGPYGCSCGWSENEEYDTSNGPKYTKEGYVLDQWGGAKKASSLQEVKDGLAQELYKMTTAEAIKQNVCIQCKKPITEKSFYSAAGKREYRISGLCEYCFDEIV